MIVPENKSNDNIAITGVPAGINGEVYKTLLARRQARSAERDAKSRHELAGRIKEIIRAMTVGSGVTDAEGRPLMSMDELLVDSPTYRGELDDNRLLGITSPELETPRVYTALYEGQGSAADVTATLGQLANGGGNNSEPKGV